MLRLLPLLTALLILLLVLPPPPSDAGKLSDDGRAGVVLDVQGTALFRPAGRERWTPLGAKSVLFPGDLLRTSARGAHAIEMTTRAGRVLMGPAGLLELQKDGALRLLRGELEVTGSQARALPVSGPGGYEAELSGTAWLRAKDGSTKALEERPRWIQDYRASASDEWMGSLLAQVDGKDVPLAVGYHKVDVEVRDQIARTTVEQSFVNTTSSRLEGVFYFPLPADASISGFGMWIGGELVEADIVERQRARQIYEDILRRKKDPGLLEWEGGNIFKARVFPIEAHSEKRIRIRYTQVLPMERDGWRYRYALRSELLRSKPLRELRITVRVVSSTPMLEVVSPTHDVMVHKTGHEATVEFLANEFSPEKDFEVAVRLKRKQALGTVAHRRGEDGYFMLLLSPPDPEAGAWRRDLAPEGDPLDVVLLADTSGSMDEAARANQAGFIAAFLELLSETDRFRLAACDVDTQWMLPSPSAPTEENIENALALLAGRSSLGWTDLDQALSAALAGATGNTLLVYVGDGVGTTGDADPVALAERLRAHVGKTKATVHAVAASSSYEAPVLSALAEIGGGSLRQIGARPALSAFALLAEAARPALRDIEVRIDGIRTARLYPQRLPNLPLGAQQVLLGRFLPTGQAQQGTVTVTGRLAGETVRYSTALEIPAGDEGNAFLPRLWARRHIDALLAEGRSTEVQAEVVSFSERLGIMTPYTSFLVLESDEDRERYGVTRRVRMRDGERFFADTKDRAVLVKRRDAMKAAGRWLLQLRTTMLREIARLGRDLPIALPPTRRGIAMESEAAAFGTIADHGESIQVYSRYGEGGGGAAVDSGLRLGSALQAANAPSAWGDAGSELAKDSIGIEGKTRGGLRNESFGAPPAASAAPTSPVAGKPPARRGRRSEKVAERDEMDEDVEEVMEAESLNFRMPSDPGRGSLRSAGLRFSAAGEESLARRLAYQGRPWVQPYAFTLQSLGFPSLPAAVPSEDKDALEPWDADVLALLQSLPRRAALGQIEGGLHLVLEHHLLHATRGVSYAGERTEAWLGTASWQIQRESDSFTEPHEHWVFEGTRGALAAARRLARTREATKEDAAAWTLPLWDLQSRDPIASWRRQRYRARIVSQADHRAVVTLKRPEPTAATLRLVIDTQRLVVLEQQVIAADGKVLSRTVHKDLVRVADRFWAQKTQHFDAKNRVVRQSRLSIEALEEPSLRAALVKAAAARADVLTVPGKLPSKTDAKQALHEKRAVFIDLLVMTIGYAQEQRWKLALETLDAAEALIQDKPGRRFVHGALLAAHREGEERKRFVSELLPVVLEGHGAARRFLVSWLAFVGHGALGPRERGQLLDDIKTAWVDAEESGAPWRELRWFTERSNAFTQARMEAEGRRINKLAAESFPFAVQAQLRFEADLWTVGRYEEALGLLDRLRKEREPWLAREREQIYTRLTNRLWERRQLKALHEVLLAWTEFVPESSTPYRRLFSSFYFLGDTDLGDGAVLAALKQRLAKGTPRALWARQEAAVQLALGQGWNFNLNRVQAGWGHVLADLCRDLMQLGTGQPNSARTIFTNWRFRRTNAYAELRKRLYQDIGAPDAVSGMSPARLARYVQMLSWGRNAVDAELWARVVTQLEARWLSLEDARERAPFAQHLLTLLDAHGERERGILFARTRLERARDVDRTRFAKDLFRRLLQTPDRDEHTGSEREDECFVLLASLTPVDAELETRKAGLAQAVRQLVDRIYRWRFESGIGTPKEREPLSRAARKALRRETRRRVRGELAERLALAEGSAVVEAKPWLRIERLGYAVQHGTGHEAVVDEALGVLQADWKRADRPLDRILRERAAVILAYAGIARGASAETIEKVMSAYRAGQETLDKARAEDPQVIERLDWRYQMFRLLVALDRADGLEALLRDWIVPAKVESRWRIALAYLLAETGRLPEAVTQFEAVRALDELSSVDYQHLANWYLVLGDEKGRSAALAARYDHMNQNELASELWRLQNSASKGPGGVPGDLDPQVFPVLNALMRKARHPANYWHRARNLYRARKDFRLLECVADALDGHTKEAIYGFLGRVTALTHEIHEEATLDALSARLTARLRAVERPLDQRAFYLALALVEGRASHVLEADPAHAARALAALESAFQQVWEDGEPQLMAGFLRALGQVKDAATRKEQLRQLEALRTASPSGSMPHLQIAFELAQTHWIYDEKERALAVLEAALAATRKAQGGRIPMEGNAAFDAHVNWLAQLGRFASAERVLQREIGRWALPWRRRGLTQRLYKLYVDALNRKGSVSLGRGTTVFWEAAALMERDILANPAQAGNVLRSYCALHRAAQERRVDPKAGARLVRVAREKLPALFARVPLNAARYASTVADMIRVLRGPREALAFLLDRVDAEPRWLERVGRDTWQQSSYNLARWRKEAGNLGPLEPRLLKLVTGRLEKDLLVGGQRSGGFWNRGNKWFWGTKEQAFADVAGRVAELNEKDAAVLTRAATFLHNGLARRQAGIAVLEAAHTRGLLELRTRWTLTRWLKGARRWPEARPLCEALVEERPDELDYRVGLAEILSGLKQAAAAAAVLDGAETHWRSLERWREGHAASLGNAAARLEMAARAERWMEEAIRLRQEARGYVGGRDSTFARYYRDLATARALLGKTGEAVRAAATAIQSTEPNNRREMGKARAVLERTLRTAPALAAYVESYEAEVSKSGLDAPLIRKALAKVHAARGNHKAAVRQLHAARDLDAGDAEIHNALVQAFDQLGDGAAAVQALFGSIRLAPHNLDAYVDLEARYRRAGDLRAAERALTTLVEPAPHQAEGHRRLALRLQALDRWPAASVQWQQVVRTERLDPTGWLALARAHMHLSQTESARLALEHVLQNTWEPRFGEPKQEAAKLLQTLGN